MTPHKCPVCNGTALVSIPPGVAGDMDSFVSSETGPWKCRACVNGILWESEPVFVPSFSIVEDCQHQWHSDTAGTFCTRCSKRLENLTYTITKANQ